MLILEYVEKNRCRGSNGVGYCPFPVLCRDTIVVSRAGVGVPGKACCNRPSWVLCRDRDFSVVTGFSCSVSQHSLGVATRSGLWVVSR